MAFYWGRHVGLSVIAGFNIHWMMFYHLTSAISPHQLSHMHKFASSMRMTESTTHRDSSSVLDEEWSRCPRFAIPKIAGRLLLRHVVPNITSHKLRSYV